MYKMIIENFPKSYQLNHNCIEHIGRYNKKNDLKSNSEPSSYCYSKKNTKVVSTYNKEKVLTEKWAEYQNVLILKFPIKMQEEVKFLRIKWIKRNDNSRKSITNWGSSL